MYVMIKYLALFFLIRSDGCDGGRRSGCGGQCFHHNCCHIRKSPWTHAGRSIHTHTASLCHTHAQCRTVYTVCVVLSDRLQRAIIKWKGSFQMIFHWCFPSLISNLIALCTTHSRNSQLLGNNRVRLPCFLPGFVLLATLPLWKLY